MPLTILCGCTDLAGNPEYRFSHNAAHLFLFKLMLCFTDVEIPDDGSGDPFDFKFVRWMTKNKVSYYLFTFEPRHRI